MTTDPRPIRILYLIDTLDVGGTERSLVATLPLLTGVDATVCHLFPGDELKPDLEDAGIPVHSLDLPGDYPLAAALRAVNAVVLATKPDLIHAMLFRAGIVARLTSRSTGVPLLNSLVNDSYAAARFHAHSPAMRAKLRTVQLVDRLTAPLALHFVANTRAIKRANSAALRIPPHKISVIYRGRDPSVFVAPNPSAVDALRCELQIPPDAPVLLNVARLAVAKNQRDLIRALPAVRRALPSATLLIAGEGPERPVLQHEIERLGLGDSVRLLGNRTDIPDLLHLADLFAFPSLYEGHPGALIEAMFAARPIVASDIAVHRETLLDGALGELAPLGDVDALAQRIIALLRNPAHARNLAACAQASAGQRFDIRTVAAQHDALYRALLDPRRLAP